MDRYRGDRRSPPRYVDREPGPDSYIPVAGRGGYRPRSRSPPPRGDSYRGRPRSPPPRRYDDYDRRRDYPPPDLRFDDRDMRRGRDYSPPRGGLRSPRRSPPPRRTYSPPRDGYRTRSRSPVRREDTYPQKQWRRRSISPGRDNSGRGSHASSRRSSPRPFPRRPAETYQPDSYRSPRPLSPRRRSPPPLRPRSPYSETPRPRESPYSFPHGEPHPRDIPSSPAAMLAATDYRDRAPPSGPRSSAISPPTGPSAPTAPASAYIRPPSASGPPNAPAYRTPRGGYAPSPYRSGRGDFGSPTRGSFGGPPPRGGYVGSAPPARDPYLDSRPPPRGGGGGGGMYAAPGGPPFRGSNNSTSTTYPRTQRFNNHLADLSTLKPGGKKLPALHDTGRADRLEEEAARLRKLIDEKETRKRRGLREWDRISREVDNAALKSELAEEHLRALNGGEEGEPAF